MCVCEKESISLVESEREREYLSLILNGHVDEKEGVVRSYSLKGKSNRVKHGQNYQYMKNIITKRSVEVEKPYKK